MVISPYRPRKPPFEPDLGIRSPKLRGVPGLRKLIGVSLPNSISRSGRTAKSRGFLGLRLEGGVLGLYRLMIWVDEEARATVERSLGKKIEEVFSYRDCGDCFFVY